MSVSPVLAIAVALVVVVVPASFAYADDGAAARVLLVVASGTRPELASALRVELAGRNALVYEQSDVVWRDAREIVLSHEEPLAYVRVESLGDGDAQLLVQVVSQLGEHPVDRATGVDARIDDRTLAMIVSSMLYDPVVHAPPRAAAEPELVRRHFVDNEWRSVSAETSASPARMELATPSEVAPTAPRQGVRAIGYLGLGWIGVANELGLYSGGIAHLGASAQFGEHFEIATSFELGLTAVPSTLSTWPFLRGCLEAAGRLPAGGGAAVRFGGHGCVAESVNSAYVNGTSQSQLEAFGTFGVSIAVAVSLLGVPIWFRADFDSAPVWIGRIIPSLRVLVELQ